LGNSEPRQCRAGLQWIARLKIADAALPVTTATSREEPTEATDPVAQTIPGPLGLR